MRAGLRLPTEIWSLIASYTDARTLKNLFSLNQAFFYPSMDVWYKSVSLESVRDKRFMRNVVRLSDPFVAQLVQSLYIDASFIREVESSYDQYDANTDEDVPEEIFLAECHHPLRARNGQYFKSSKEVIEAIRRALPLLTCVTEFTFVVNELAHLAMSYEEGLNMIRHCLMSFGDTSRKLKMTLTYDAVPTVLSPSLTMSSLTNVRIDLLESMNDDEPPETSTVLNTLCAFVGNFNRNLRSFSLLAVDPPNSSYRVGFSALFKELANFSSLSNLGLHLPLGSIPRVDLVNVLKANSKILKSFGWSGNSREVIDDNAYTWLQEEFPKSSILQKLDTLLICRSALYPINISTRNWLAHFQNLHSLIIHYDVDNADKRFKDYQYEQFIRNLPTNESLRWLRLHALFFDKDLLTALMLSYPKLEGLSLKFGSVELRTDEDREKVKSNPAIYFRKSLDEEALSQWGIKHLQIWSWMYPARMMNQFCDMFTEVFPSLETCENID